MQKTRLGITAGLLGAAIYFMGAISIIPAFLLAGYVLLFEDNDWLKNAAVKMAIVVIGFSILRIGVGLIDDVLGIINSILNWIVTVNLSVPLNLISIIQRILSLLENVVLIILGLKALSMGTIKSKFFDKIINKHM